MKKLKKDIFGLPEIRRVREESAKRHAKMTKEEILKDINDRAAMFLRDVEKLRKTKEC